MPSASHPLSPSAQPSAPSASLAAPLANRLLAWYDRHARALPWRAPPGRYADPYHVWLSEVMLQQTTVAAVGPYFQRFLERWPTVAALAQAPLDEVLTAWAGLGYYARARNLHKCAQEVAGRCGGRFPEDEEALLQLPGIGDYTAAAIAAIAFGRPAAVMDGNIERVVARLFAVTEPLPAVKPRLKALAAGLTPAERPGDYAQAAMDLGATICTPAKPACVLCPWMSDCAARRLGIAESLPAKLAKPPRPLRHGMAFWTLRKDGAVLLRRRPDRGLLGGMMEIPSTDWRGQPWDLAEALTAAPAQSRWHPLPGIVTHGFTHFQLQLTVLVGRVERPELAKGLWCSLDGLGDQALPTLMRKVVRHALAKAY
jgi:A/G-specific adenine glycosylase